MSLVIKICGISDAECAAAAAAAGADLLGFVFHQPSPRNVTPARAAAIAAVLPPGTATVAVFLHPCQALVDAACEALRPRWLQMDAADFRQLALPAGCELLPVIRDAAAAPEPLPPRLLFEGMRSGAGHRADWQAAARLARACRLLLAGGLDAHSVAEAIRIVRPWGVDVSSGVESAPGVKEPARIEAFIAAARAAQRPLEETHES